MATAYSNQAICRIDKDRTLKLETTADRIHDYYGIVVIEEKLLVIDYNASNLQLYNRHDGKLISKSHRLEYGPYGVCLISETEVAVCLNGGTIVILPLISINDVKLFTPIKTRFDVCYSVAKLNPDKLVVSGSKDGYMLCWGIVSTTNRRMDSAYNICRGYWTNIAIKDNTVYISCRTGDSITTGVHAYDIFNPDKKKFMYQHHDLKEPGSVMADRDCVYVCDYNSKRIHQLTNSGRHVTIHTVSSSLNKVFYDEQHGLLYTTSYESNVITVYKMVYLHQRGNSVLFYIIALRKPHTSFICPYSPSCSQK